MGEVHEGDRRRWTGWSRSRSAASPSPPPRRPASGATTASTSSTRPATSTSPIEVERSLRVLDGAVAVFARSAASSRSPRRSGARPTSTACRASPSSTSAIASAPIPTAACSEIRERLKATPDRRSRSPSALEDAFSGVVDLIEMKLRRLGGRHDRRRVRSSSAIPDELREARRAGARHDDRGDRRGRRRGRWRLYLDGSASCPRELIRAALRRATVAGHARAGALRRGLQEQGRAAAARRRRRLPAVAGRHPAGARACDPDGKRTESRAAADDEPFSALAFKIMNDPFVGHADLLPRLLRQARDGHDGLQRDQGQARADRPPPAHARQQARGHRRGRPAATSPRPSACAPPRTGDTLCDEKHPIMLELMEFPAAGHLDRHRAEDAGRPGQARRRRSQKLAIEDPSFRVTTDAETGQTIISRDGRAAPRDHRRPPGARVQGRGQRRASPQVAYRETITPRGRGRGQVHPADRRARPVRPRHAARRAGRARQRASSSRTPPSAASIPREFVPAVETGVREALARGVLARLPDGRRRSVSSPAAATTTLDSSEMAFKIAGSHGRRRRRRARPRPSCSSRSWRSRW